MFVVYYSKAVLLDQQAHITANSKDNAKFNNPSCKQKTNFKKSNRPRYINKNKKPKQEQ